MNTVRILRSVEELADATGPELVATYNALTTGKPVTRFASAEVGRRRVEMAMLAAKDADGHLGVPKGGEGEVRTAAELAVKAEEKGLPAPDVLAEEAPTFPAGTLASKLQAQAATAEPITPRPRAEPKKPNAGERKARLVHVKATGKGTTKVRIDSQRGHVFAYINGFERGTPVAIADIEKHVQFDPRDHVKKLAMFDHVVFCDAEGNEPAADTTGELPLE